MCMPCFTRRLRPPLLEIIDAEKFKALFVGIKMCPKNVKVYLSFYIKWEKMNILSPLAP